MKVLHHTGEEGREAPEPQTLEEMAEAEDYEEFLRVMLEWKETVTEDYLIRFYDLELTDMEEALERLKDRDIIKVETEPDDILM